MGNTQTAPKLFSPVRIDLPCVLFFKTRPPIDPVDFVQRICEEIVKKPGMRRMRYVNRLTPVTLVGKANEKGLEELGKAVLSHDFQLSGQDDVNPLVAGNADADAAGKASPYSVSSDHPKQSELCQ
jgi:tRNA acetyltransferase TAN1